MKNKTFEDRWNEPVDTEACREALQRFIDGKQRLCIPANHDDDDILLTRALDELDRLRLELELCKDILKEHGIVLRKDYELMISEGRRIIEWEDGYPCKASLRRLRRAVKSKDYKKAIKAFYEALRENYYGEDYCGPEQVEVRGEIIDVWGYHTGGWSGNEDIIAILEESWLFHWLLERYDAGGHYYFRPIEKVLKEEKSESDAHSEENM